MKKRPSKSGAPESLNQSQVASSPGPLRWLWAKFKEEVLRTKLIFRLHPRNALTALELETNFTKRDRAVFCN